MEENLKIEEIFKEDKLQRKQTIARLTALIENNNDFKVLAINASWGMGKTTFVKLWLEYLKARGIPSLYFSAWEDDYSDEPLIAIFGEIQNYIKSCENLEDKVEKSFQKVIESTAKIAFKGSLALLKAYLRKKFSDEELGQELTEILGKEFENRITDYPKDKKLLEEIKESLKELFKNISSQKFVIFIDELDRCRPLYAIELLERIKHLFGTSGAIFVLSIDKKQLGESIKSQYGNIDTNQYLKRFIDLEYELKSSNRKVLYKSLYNYTMGSECEYDKSNLELIETLASDKCLNLSLREIEQCFKQIKFIVSMDKDHQTTIAFKYIKILIVLIFLKARYSLQTFSPDSEVKQKYNNIQNEFSRSMILGRLEYRNLFEEISEFLIGKSSNPDISKIYHQIEFTEDFKF